jgi:hypothetical protein
MPPFRVPSFLALIALSGCYVQPTTADDTGVSAQESAGDDGGVGVPGDDGTWNGGGGGGSGGGDGEVQPGDDRGRLSEGDYSVYWRWYGYASWPEGACVEIRFKNNGPDLENWTLTLDLDASFTRWVYEDGGFLWPEGDTLVVEPLNDPSLGSGEDHWVYFCAEPRVQVTGFSVEGRLSEGGDGSGGDDGGGDDGGVSTGSSGQIEMNNELLLLWRPAGVSYGGACTEFSVLNRGTAAVQLGEVVVELDRTAGFTDWWNLVPVMDGADLLLYYPSNLNPLDAGEAAAGTVCLDAAVTPLAARAAIE